MGAAWLRWTGEEGIHSERAWDGNWIYVGGLGEGKSHKLAQDLVRDGGPAIFYDPAKDAKVRGAIQADRFSSPAMFRRVLSRGHIVLFRGAGLRQAKGEVRWLCKIAAEFKATLAIDEAHQVAKQSQVEPELADEWERARHDDVRIRLASPVPQELDHHLRITARRVYVFRGLFWSDWMPKLGISHDLWETLQASPRHSYATVDGGRVDGITVPR